MRKLSCQLFRNQGADIHQGMAWKSSLNLELIDRTKGEILKIVVFFFSKVDITSTSLTDAVKMLENKINPAIFLYKNIPSRVYNNSFSTMTEWWDLNAAHCFIPSVVCVWRYPSRKYFTSLLRFTEALDRFSPTPFCYLCQLLGNLIFFLKIFMLIVFSLFAFSNNYNQDYVVFSALWTHSVLVEAIFMLCLSLALFCFCLFLYCTHYLFCIYCLQLNAKSCL